MLSFIIISIVAAAVAEVTHEGNCPDLKPVENLNLTAYQGSWYEISKYPYESEKNGKCASAEYKLEGDVVKVKNTHVVNGVQTYIEGTAKFAEDAKNSGKLMVTFQFGDVLRTSPLLILATDYSNYAIAFNCKYDEKKKSHQDTAWILSRSKKLEGDAKIAVVAFLKSHAKEIDATKLEKTDFSEEACKFTGASLITEPAKH